MDFQKRTYCVRVENVGVFAGKFRCIMDAFEYFGNRYSNDILALWVILDEEEEKRINAPEIKHSVVYMYD
jgi:hypothetical protein